MSAPWEKPLTRWMEAGLVDEATAARIRDFESTRAEPPHMRRSVVLAAAFGGLLLAAGVLLFVSAHWDELGPAARMALIVLMVAVFHLGAVFARFPVLTTTLHAVGTLTLGGAIAMAGQVYNMAEHWPFAVLVWALGAWAGFWILRDWPQLVLAALLTPAWIYSEIEVRLNHKGLEGSSVFLFLLSIAYMSADPPSRREAWRRALSIAGTAAVIPTALGLLVNYNSRTGYLPFAPVLGILACAVAWLLRGRESWRLAAWLPWTAALVFVAMKQAELTVYFLYAAGSVMMAYWGVHESRAERINIGFAGFAATVLVFYFSNVMTTLDRSLSLILLGVLFLLGGWLLEKLRRGVLGSMNKGEA